jgi:MFS family permease
VGAYFAQVFHLVGAGFLATSVTAVVGGSGQSTWLVATMTIMTAALCPPVSQAADYWGRKWFLVVLSACGCVGCIIVSRSNSIAMVIAGQTIGGAALGAQSLVHAISSEILPRKSRPYAQAATNIASTLGAIVGLLTGGALTNTNPGGFRTYWYIAAAFYAAITLIVMILYNPPIRELQMRYTTAEKLAKLDWIGYALLIAGLVLFSVALTSSLNPYSWTDAHIYATFTTGSALLILFVLYEWKFTKIGMLHHGLFSRGRNFPIALFGITVEGIVFFASNNYYGYETAVVYEKDQFTAGLRYTVNWFTYLVITGFAGAYCSRTKTVRIPLIIAFSSFTLYNGLMASLGVNSEASILGFAVFLGIGLGISLNALIVLSQLSTPPELISTATGLMITARSMGGTLGLCIYTALFSNSLSHNLGDNIADATVPLGLKPVYLGDLIDALMAKNQTELAEIPGISQEIIGAAALALRQTFVICFRYIWVTAAAIAAVAVLGALPFVPLFPSPFILLTTIHFVFF